MEQKKLERFLIYFIGVVAFFVVFVALKQTAEDTYFITALLGLFGSLFTLWRFSKSAKENPFRSLFDLLKDDYEFDKYAYLKLSSMVYALAQGACLGTALGFSVNWIHALVSRQGGAGIYFSSIFFSLLALLGVRVLLELYSVFFKAALDIRKYVNRS